jgi:hypothetical protein
MKWISICLLPLLAVAAPAAAESLWQHNGSILQLRVKGEEHSLVYLEPRSGLRKAGVEHGSVLFKGKAKRNRYTGTAYLFSKKCGAVGYAVEGRVAEGSQNLTLSGRAPRRNSKCETLGHRSDVLVFRVHAPAQQQPAPAMSENGAAGKPKREKKEAVKMASEVEKEIERPVPNRAEAAAVLPFPVMGCKSRDTFDQWVKAFRQADVADETAVLADGMKTKDCAALKDGPVKVDRGDESYLCVRPMGKADCYWTLRASLELPR